MTLLTEQIVTLPIVNPETNGKSRSFRYMGKVDRVEGRKMIDWKGVSDPDRFIKEKRIGLQPYLYALALQAADIEIDEIEYRLVKFPTISLCGKDDKGAKETGQTPEAYYEDRCVKEFQKDPSKVHEHALLLNPGRIDKARQMLWDASKRVLDCRNRGTWAPNEFACFTWNRTCEYMGLCELVADGQSPHTISDFEFESRVRHPELDNDFGDVLTVSSMAVLRLCETKYFWRYERAIAPKSDYAEARWTGSAMHVGLEAYAKKEDWHAAIDEWLDENPAIGDGVRYADQQCAKARAMVRVAMERWPIGKNHEPAGTARRRERR